MNSSLASMLSSLVVANLGASVSFTYSPTPFGAVLSHCLHEVPSGAKVTARSDGSTLVITPDGSKKIIAQCEANGGWPVWRASSEMSRDAPYPLPADYDGWLEYTALNVSALGLSGGFDAFTSVMSVPDVPKRKAQMLYFFPGLQNRDWIPKVDPFPTKDNPFDIIQPVLQYPGVGLFSSNKWALKSWYVTVNAGALFSTAVKGIEPGDAIICNMTRTGPQSWSVSGALRSDPAKVTTQEATAPRLQLQPWAYSAVAECYGCDGCDTYPTQPITFSKNKLSQAGREVNVPGSSWQLNPKPALKRMCNETTTVDQITGDATIAFR